MPAPSTSLKPGPVLELAETPPGAEPPEPPVSQKPSKPPTPIDPTVRLLLGHLADANQASSKERLAQTEAFTAAMGKLGDRFEAQLAAQTRTMARAAYMAAGVVVFTLAILGSIAGAVTVFRGNGFEARVGEKAMHVEKGEPTELHPSEGTSRPND